MVRPTLFKKVAKEKGTGGEARILNLLLSNKDAWPEWLHSIRAATYSEDQKGCDVVIATDVGKLYLQVKSSWTGIEHFKKKRKSKMIETILSRPQDDPKEVFRIAIRKLSDMRNQIAKMRGWI